MNQSEVERAVARATGESRRFIRRFGFSLLALEPEYGTNPALALDCPGCGAALDPDHVVARLSEVECPRCDAVYPLSTDEIYVVDTARSAEPSCV